MSSLAMREPAVDPLTIDEILGHRRLRDAFRVIRQIGHGGIGVVYLVEHVHLRKLMSLKVLHADVGARVDVLRFFFREMRQLSRLTHPHTVALFDAGQLKNGDVYVLMEYIPGIDLDHFLQLGRELTIAQMIEIGIQLCHALAHAHSVGVFLRDMKPSNVMLAEAEGEGVFVKLLDFGLTAAIERACRVPKIDESALAPELIQGAPASPQADLYGVGTLMYRLLTGESYWPACDRDRLLEGDAFPDFPHSHQLRALIWQTLSPEPTQRPVSAAILGVALEQLGHLFEAEADTGEADAYASNAVLTASDGSLFDAPDATPIDASEVLTSQEWRRFRKRYELISWSFRLLIVVFFLGGLTAMIQYFHVKAQHAAGPAARQEKEPNGTSHEGTLVQLQRWVYGAFGCGRCKRPIAPEHDIDWYRFVITEDEALVGLRLLAPKDIGVSIALYRAGQPMALVALSQHEQDNEIQIPAVQLQEGHYYVRIRALKITEAKGQSLGYRFRIERRRQHQRGEAEPNDTTSTANVIAVGAFVDGLHDRPGDTDMFVFSLPSSGQLRQLAARCSGCLPQRERSPALANVWKKAPLFRLRFTPVAGVKASLLLLNAKSRPIKVIRRSSAAKEHDGDNDRDKPQDDDRDPADGSKDGYRAIYGSEKGNSIDIYFAGVGRHYLQIKAVRGFHYKRRYIWRLEVYAIR